MPIMHAFSRRSLRSSMRRRGPGLPPPPNRAPRERCVRRFHGCAGHDYDGLAPARIADRHQLDWTAFGQHHPAGAPRSRAGADRRSGRRAAHSLALLRRPGARPVAARAAVGPVGRRPVLLGGFVLTMLTSMAAAGAMNIAFLIAARTTQALGAATGIVVGRAIIRDLYQR